MPIESAHRRPLRSYVRREGRITIAQQRALDHLWSRHGLAASEPLPAAAFAVCQPLVLEIGFGMGQSLLRMALDHPHENYIGVEVYRPGVGALLAEMEKQGVVNIRVYQEDVNQVCAHAIPAHGLHRVQVFFPDPWPKKKHHKRRLLQPSFLSVLACKLELGGVLHVATDVDSYAEHIREILEKHPDFVALQSVTQLPYQRPSTKFERAGLAKGHQVHDIVYQRLEQ